jgi:MHS family proline/betaine transporter-like MFS transporter
LSTNAGCLLGSGVGALLVLVLGRQDLEAWGWRVPFLLGAGLGVAGLCLRLSVEETPQFQHLTESQGVVRLPLGEALRHQRWEMVAAFSLLWLSSVGFFTVFVYLPGYLTRVGRLPLDSVMIMNWLGIVVAGVVTPFVGAWSDRIGRKPPVLFAAAGLLILSYPLFWLLAQGVFVLCLTAQCLFAVLLATLASPQYALLVELFTTRARYTALSLPWGVAAALFGGTAPLLATYLVERTGDPRSPGLYLMLSAAVTVGVVCLIRETYREPLR